jgi:hypothetical protein
MQTVLKIEASYDLIREGSSRQDCEAESCLYNVFVTGVGVNLFSFSSLTSSCGLEQGNQEYELCKFQTPPDSNSNKTFLFLRGTEAIIRPFIDVFPSIRKLK